MARSFNGSSDYAKVTGTMPVTGYPFTLAAWFKCTTTSGIRRVAILSKATASMPDGHVLGSIFLNYPSGGNISGQSFNGSANALPAASANFSTTEWNHGVYSCSASNSHKIYLNGANSGTDGTSVTPDTPDQFHVGGNYSAGTQQQYLNGAAAEVALWSAALTDAEIASLARGFSPKLIRPQSLAAYWPLIGRASPEPDLRGGFNLTLTGTAQADHPRVYYPGRRRTVFVPGAGGGFSDATGSSSLTFAAAAVGSSLASATGSSSIAFTPTAAGSSLADATGAASLAFAASATGSALADADGSSALTFTPTAAGSALADTAGSVALTFAASATGSSQIDATGAATLAFTASAVGSSVADATGAAALTFTASASSGGFEDATGSATLTFAASATGSALVSATGSSTLTFAALATGETFADATGAATLTFSCSAVSSDGSQVAALEITATLTTLLSLTVSVASALNLDVTVTDQFDVEEQGMPSPQVGDIGTPIVVTVRDVAGEIMPLGTTTLRQVILSRRGVTRTYSASLYTDGADGKIVYTSQDGDFDVAGPWLARGRVEFGGGAQHWTSPPVNFTVEGA